MAELLFRLGRGSARRAWLVILGWVVVLGLAGAGYGLFGGTISSAITIPGTATSKVTDELARKFPSASGGSGSIVFTTTNGRSFTASQQADIATFLTSISHLSGVRATVNPFSTQAELDAQRAQVTAGTQQLQDSTNALAAARAQLQAAHPTTDAQRQALAAQQSALDASAATLAANQAKLAVSTRLLALSAHQRFVSADGTAAIGTVTFRAQTTAVPADLKTTIVDKAAAAGIDGVQVYPTNDIAQGVPSVVGPGEVIGLLVAAIALFVMLSTLIGAALPLVSALLGLGVALCGALSFSSLVEFVSVTPVLGLMLGLAVGIDYSLFILNRHRSQLKQGADLYESIGLANATSGNAVVFAGSTVIVALLALNITGIPFLSLMGTVGAVAVAVAICVAVSFTPALLGLVGMRILRRTERATIGHAHHAPVDRAPMATWRAVGTLIVGVVVLGIVATPALHMRLGLPDGSSEATDSGQYRAYTILEKKFGAGQNGPLLVVADLPAKVSAEAVLGQEATIGERIAARSHVAAVLPIGASSDRTVLAFQVVPTGGPSSTSTETLVHDLRDLSPITTSAGRVTLGVAGNASANIDVSEKLGAVLPLYLTVVVGLSLLILIVVFRSILVPVTATAGFILSLAATFGAVTAIYQFGWLHQIFGVHDPAPILSFLPILEMGILFGLAMDYQLFLVSGMREAWAHGASPRVAVQRGLGAGRPVVTAAAIIMVAVFSGFIFSDSSTIRPIGFGLAFGVLVDAFVIRMVLIPAAMHLLGASAWWFPRWLDALLPNVDVEGAGLQRAHPIPAAQVDSPLNVMPIPAEPDPGGLR